MSEPVLQCRPNVRGACLGPEVDYRSRGLYSADVCEGILGGSAKDRARVGLPQAVSWVGEQSAEEHSSGTSL